MLSQSGILVLTISDFRRSGYVDLIAFSQTYRRPSKTAASEPPNYEPEGRVFESPRAHHKNQGLAESLPLKLRIMSANVGGRLSGLWTF